MTKTNPTSSGLQTWLSGSGALGGVAAFIGASCCVLPLVLVQLGIATSLVPHLAWFARWQPYLFWAAAAILALSATLALWRGQPSLSFWIRWAIGAIFLAAAFVLPNYELQILHWIRG
jgi:mercuric ion transport protein